jgi:hypothetical protein
MRFRLDAARAAREGEKLLTDGDGDATQVPVCHARGDSNAMRVFFREVVTAARGKLTSEERKSLPAVLFLQGGPGFECAGPLERLVGGNGQGTSSVFDGSTRHGT